VELSKSSSNYFRGIEYIVVDDLPNKQRGPFLEWISSEEIIKISTRDQVIENCVSYSIYSDWFESEFVLKINTEEKTIVERLTPIKLNPAL